VTADVVQPPRRFPPGGPSSCYFPPHSFGDLFRFTSRGNIFFPPLSPPKHPLEGPLLASVILFPSASLPEEPPLYSPPLRNQTKQRPRGPVSRKDNKIFDPFPPRHISPFGRDFPFPPPCSFWACLAVVCFPRWTSPAFLNVNFLPLFLSGEVCSPGEATPPLFSGFSISSQTSLISRRVTDGKRSVPLPNSPAPGFCFHPSLSHPLMLGATLRSFGDNQN